MSFKFYLLVGLGGGIGSILRALVGYLFRGFLPLPTLLVNLTGALLIGICIKHMQQSSSDELFRAFWIIGICGGYTTFSTFGLDALTFLKSSQWLNGIMYVIANILGTILAIVFGFKLYSLIKS